MMMMMRFNLLIVVLAGAVVQLADAARAIATARRANNANDEDLDPGAIAGIVLAAIAFSAFCDFVMGGGLFAKCYGFYYEVPHSLWVSLGFTVYSFVSCMSQSVS